jgi:hypothetical protein
VTTPSSTDILNSIRDFVFSLHYLWTICWSRGITGTYTLRSYKVRYTFLISWVRNRRIWWAVLGSAILSWFHSEAKPSAGLHDRCHAPSGRWKTVIHWMVYIISCGALHMPVMMFQLMLYISCSHLIQHLSYHSSTYHRHLVATAHHFVVPSGRLMFCNWSFSQVDCQCHPTTSKTATTSIALLCAAWTSAPQSHPSIPESLFQRIRTTKANISCLLQPQQSDILQCQNH